MNRWFRAAQLAAFLILGSGALAAQNEPVPLPRLSGPIVLDGVLDEPAWDALDKLPFTNHAPRHRAPLSFPSDVYVAYDDEYLYVGGRMFDEPGGPRSNTLYRDQFSGDDLFSIVIDSYNDYESGVWFTASPAGVRSDRTVMNDAQFTTGRPMNNDWNAHWDLATTEDETGWHAEMRIPLSTLGFTSVDGRVVIGIIVYRYIARLNERHVYPDIPPNWGMAFAKPSQALRVSMEGVSAGRPVYVTPYALGGINFNSTLNGDGSRYVPVADEVSELGVDLKYSVTSNLALDATINTDFAQVEADSQQVNLTRFSLFFPEKRQFFQERASLFEVTTGGFSRLFHSRRIGLSPTGEPLRILGGARLVGRLGSTDIGVLSMQTAEEGSTPSENFSVARVKRQVFNPYSSLGALVTARTDAGGGYAFTGGIDGSFRVTGDEYVIAKWAGTIEEADPAAPRGSLLDASLFLLQWERRNQVGLSYSNVFVRSGPEYRPRMGFVQRSDFMQGQNNLEYRWFQGAGSPIRSITLGVRSSAFMRNADRAVESASSNPVVRFEMNNGHRINVTLENSYESVLDSFLVGGAAPVVPGDYWFHEGNLEWNWGRSGFVRGGMGARYGTFYDGTRLGVSGGPTISFSRHFEMGSNYQFNTFDFPDRGETFTSHLAQIRLQGAADVHLSGSILLQYSSAADRVGVNARIRYHYSEGSDLWLVYNDDLHTERMVIGSPRLPLSRARSLMAKYTYTLK